MTCKEEPSSIFGAFAFPKWNNNGEYVKDPKE